jgi:hypothetical protein
VEENQKNILDPGCVSETLVPAPKDVSFKLNNACILIQLSKFLELSYSMNINFGLFVFSLRVILAWKTWFARDLRLGGHRYKLWVS